MVTMEAPTHGYFIPLWNSNRNYRATAVAYMKRENIKQVKNKDGKFYTLEQLEKSLIGVA